MKRIEDVLRCGLLLAAIALLISLAAAALAVRHATRQAERDELQLAPRLAGALDSVQAIEQNTTRTEAEMSGLLNTQRHAIQDEKKVLDAGAAAFTHFGTAADSLNELIVSAKKPVESLNGTIVSLNGLLDSVKGDLHLTLTATREMVEAVTADLNDPEIKASLGNIAELTAALKDAAIKGDAIMLDLKKIGDHFEVKIDTPATKGQKFVAGARVAAKIIGDLIKF